MISARSIGAGMRGYGMAGVSGRARLRSVY